ncbi:DUF7402 domain-containing protein [Flagellimonas nanhaiensis]|uniref:DUF7402 domain-containing protein n=1 Tax=Flagellimonas nanhaiensis TaxID=2292706 RepID=A0A371JTK6_9FLAO|nr:hypothetical protein [Allomuricauda nanhaiensis]RDY61127.1 hypothetical protein DX873_02865 [Allomuricauda nanhaiensis]
MKSASLIICIFFITNLLSAQLTDNTKREGDKADPANSPIYAYYEWENEIPNDCPFEQSEDITKVVFTGRFANYTAADTWYLQSANDGNLYSPWTDGEMDGFSTNSNIRSNAVGQAKVIGSDPLNLKFENLGRMWAGGTNYYPCVSIIVDETFYIGTYNAFNDEGYFNGFRYSKNWNHFTSNTEPDWKNQYWTNAIDLDGNFFNEKGKAKFRTPHAVNFAKNDKAEDGHIYLSAHGYSSGNGKNNWDKGDAIYLCRADASPESITNAESYEFFAGHTRNGKPIWEKGVENAKPILDWPNHLGSESITYFPKMDKYILMTCRLKEAEENLPYNVTIFWESDKITGPYKIVHYMRDWGAQTYFPNITSQFINNDGTSAWMTVASNYSVQNINPHQNRYAASMHELAFVLKDKPFKEVKLDLKNIAPMAKVWATSFEEDSRPEAVIDGIIDTKTGDKTKEWISHEGKGAMIKLEWDDAKTIDRIRVYDSPAADRWIKEGYFVFSDGSMEWMYAAPSNGAQTPTEIKFPPKTVKWVKFTITDGVADLSAAPLAGLRLGVSEIQVFEVD